MSDTEKKAVKVFKGHRRFVDKDKAVTEHRRKRAPEGA